MKKKEESHKNRSKKMRLKTHFRWGRDSVVPRERGSEGRGEEERGRGGGGRVERLLDPRITGSIPG